MPTPKASIKKRFATGNGRVGIGKAARKDDLILVLNSGSSSLKFGVYYRARARSDEEPLLTGSAEGIGRSNGTLHIRSSTEI